MDIAIHLGAHCTDEDLILRTLAANKTALIEQGVAVPPPRVARPAIRQALQGMNAAAGMPDPKVVDRLQTGMGTQRLVLSYEGFLGIYAKVLAQSRMYPGAGARAALLRDLFADHHVEFHMAIRNLATFVPAIFEASSIPDFADFVDGHDLSAMSWITPIAEIRTACPDVPLTIWCNEDLPMIWPDVLRAVSGLEGPLDGDLAILERVMRPDGFARLGDYLADNPTSNPETWRKVASAFLTKYTDESATSVEIDLPGWSTEMIERLSDIYALDVAALQARDDITFIVP